MADAPSSPDAYTKDLDEKIAQSTELHKLSSQEFDKQVVYIAGGGLALTLTFAKDIASVTSSYFVPLLLITWLCFAAALLINLFSYRRATKNYDLSTSLHRHYRECHVAGRLIDQPQCDTWKTGMQKGDAQVHQLNSWSFGSVAAGIGFFILFVLLNVLTMPNKTPTPQQTPAAKPGVAVPYEGVRGITAPSSLLTTPPPPTPQQAATPSATEAPTTKSAE